MNAGAMIAVDPANNAYLEVPAAGGVKGFALGFGDEDGRVRLDENSTVMPEAAEGVPATNCDNPNPATESEATPRPENGITEAAAR